MFENLIKEVLIASFACVGLMETIKNFLKLEKKWIYSLIMIPLAVCCYLACLYLPEWVIGSLFTISITQLCYQGIKNTYEILVKNFAYKATGSVVEKINEEE